MKRKKHNVGARLSDAFPWWVRCKACGAKNKCSHLNFCSVECNACKADVPNPLHAPFHNADDECFAPIMRHFSEIEEAEEESPCVDTKREIDPRAN